MSGTQDSFSDSGHGTGDSAYFTQKLRGGAIGAFSDDEGGSVTRQPQVVMVRQGSVDTQQVPQRLTRVIQLGPDSQGRVRMDKHPENYHPPSSHQQYHSLGGSQGRYRIAPGPGGSSGYIIGSSSGGPAMKIMGSQPVFVQPSSGGRFVIGGGGMGDNQSSGGFRISRNPSGGYVIQSATHPQQQQPQYQQQPASQPQSGNQQFYQYSHQQPHETHPGVEEVIYGGGPKQKVIYATPGAHTFADQSQDDSHIQHGPTGVMYGGQMYNPSNVGGSPRIIMRRGSDVSVIDSPSVMFSSHAHVKPVQKVVYSSSGSRGPQLLRQTSLVEIPQQYHARSSSLDSPHHGSSMSGTPTNEQPYRILVSETPQGTRISTSGNITPTSPPVNPSCPWRTKVTPGDGDLKYIGSKVTPGSGYDEQTRVTPSDGSRGDSFTTGHQYQPIETQAGKKPLKIFRIFSHEGKDGSPTRRISLVNNQTGSFEKSDSPVRYTDMDCRGDSPKRNLRFKQSMQFDPNDNIIQNQKDIHKFEEAIGQRMKAAHPAPPLPIRQLSAVDEEDPFSSGHLQGQTTIKRRPKTVTTTKEEILDFGNGVKKIIKTTRQESEESPPTSPQPSQGRYDSPKRNIFKKFRIVIGSCGDVSVIDDGTTTTTGSEKKQPETFYFNNFDEMMDRMIQAKLKAKPPEDKGQSDCQYTCHHPCRKSVTLDCAQNDPNKPAGDRGSPQANTTETCLTQDGPQVDDTDSGYHTGDNTLAEQARRAAGLVAKPPGEFTLTREELRKNIEAFNFNNYGLIMSLQQDSITFQGFIRVHMNLIRPINMSLSVRPPSIYEVLSHEEENSNDNNTQIASFYLPKDTTKVIHISSDTTTQEVIKALLSKFKITDNPRKFALYEQVEVDKKPVMRRCVEDEQPLPLCLSWGPDGLDTHKFVLQENDTGEIIWDAFSIPELENFLKILNREEGEYVEQIKAKYQLMNVHILKRLEDMDKQLEKQQKKDKAKLNLGSTLQSEMARDCSKKDSGSGKSLGQSTPNGSDSQLSSSGVEKASRTGKEKSPPADKFGEDKREPVFV